MHDLQLQIRSELAIVLLQVLAGYAGWTNFSDGRYKLAVNENVKGLDFVMKLRPVTYRLDMNRLAIGS